MISNSSLADMDDPREKKLRLAIKEMTLASLEKVLKEKAIFILRSAHTSRLTIY